MVRRSPVGVGTAQSSYGIFEPLNTRLRLVDNSISDISPLAGLTRLTWMDLTLNPLSYLSIMAHVPSLQRRGVEVEFDDTKARTLDVNGAGNINVLDLIVIASKLGHQGQNLATDVNQDGVVSILDLILVAGMFEDTAARAFNAATNTGDTHSGRGSGVADRGKET